MKRYNKLSTYLKGLYGQRVQRISIDAGFSCPNRSGEKGKEGCFFCDATGSGFASFGSGYSIQQQVSLMIEKYSNRAEKFILYFQSNTNTYAPVSKLKEIYDSGLCDDRIVILDISTRPDCVKDEVLELVSSYKDRYGVFIEYGAESVNPNTLKRFNRRHTYAEYIDAVIRSKKKGLDVVTHFIVDFPCDSYDDVIEMAKSSSALGISGVKLHSLYYLENTELGRMYKQKEISPVSFEEYIDRLILFLEYLDPAIVVHRLVSEPPSEGVMHGNWGMKKLELFNYVEKELERRNTYQGKYFNYLNR